MLSYRHSYHAGNHADVLKHLTQIALLQKLCEKSKPFVYLDTHSGAGLYALDSAQALQNQEYKTGVSSLLEYQGTDPLVGEYLDVLKAYWASNQYPGSPKLAEHFSRQQDSLILCELHNTEIAELKRNLNAGRCHVHHRNGFEALPALMPPTPARGMVLIDPPYEVADEYQQLEAAVNKALKRWPTGIYAIWYPLLSERASQKRQRCKTMIEKLTASAADVLQVELTVCPDTPDIGMYGSGMLILNPPWKLDEQLQAAVSDIAPLLQQDSGEWQVTWLKRS